jgi:hypothetical protein
VRVGGFAAIDTGERVVDDAAARGILRRTGLRRESDRVAGQLGVIGRRELRLRAQRRDRLFELVGLAGGAGLGRRNVRHRRDGQAWEGMPGCQPH